MPVAVAGAVAVVAATKTVTAKSRKSTRACPRLRHAAVAVVAVLRHPRPNRTTFLARKPRRAPPARLRPSAPPRLAAKNLRPKNLRPKKARWKQKVRLTCRPPHRQGPLRPPARLRPPPHVPFLNRARQDRQHRRQPPGAPPVSAKLQPLRRGSLLQPVR